MKFCEYPEDVSDVAKCALRDHRQASAEGRRSAASATDGSRHAKHYHDSPASACYSIERIMGHFIAKDATAQHRRDDNDYALSIAASRN